MNQLFVYGTLCPNRENAHILGEIGGDWQQASVHGTIHILDWGPDQGLPAMVLNEADPLVKGYLFSTDKLEHCIGRYDWNIIYISGCIMGVLGNEF